MYIHFQCSICAVLQNDSLLLIIVKCSVFVPTKGSSKNTEHYMFLDQGLACVLIARCMLSSVYMCSDTMQTAVGSCFMFGDGMKKCKRELQFK